MDKIVTEVFEIAEIIDRVAQTTASPFLFGDLGGKTLFYLYLGRNFGSEVYHDKGLRSLEMILDRMREPDGHHGSICSGVGGIAWLVDLCSREGFIEENVKDIFPTADLDLSRWVMNCFEKKNFDFLHGGTGTYIYLLNRASDTRAVSRVLVEATEKLLDNCTQLDEDKAFVPFYSCSDNVLYANRINLGASHGIISVMYALHLAVELGIATNRAADMLDNMINLIMFVTSEAFQGYHFPFFVEVPKMDVNSGSRVAWCYGDLGSASILLQVALRYGRTDLSDRMVRIISNIGNIEFENQRVDDGGICHGLIGNALVLNHVAMLMNRKDLHALADFYVQKYLSRYPTAENHRKTFIVNRGYSETYTLLEGISGIGLGLLSLLGNNTLRWKEILLLR